MEPIMTAVKFEPGADGIVTLTLDMPGRSMNVLNDELSAPLADAIAKIEADASIKGVIVTSGKQEFLAGADIEKVFAMTDADKAYALSEDFKVFLRKLETCGRPVVAALNGTALGGGLRSEEHTSELQSLMRSSYAVFCLKKNKTKQ